jgi:alpha-mannosidase
LQPEVEKIHNKDIDDALRMIEKTKNYPAEAKFKWNVESLWVVENYLKQADGATKEKFFTAVKNGDILLSGLYANILTGLSMPEEMLHYTDYAQYLRQQYQLPINSAMASDVPGFSWATVSALAKGGIKYFSSGPNYLGPNNPYLGDRVGSFVKTWGDKPVYWTSPSGKEKVLFWAGGRGYSSWHGNAPGAVFENGAKKIASYLDELDAKKYPYDMVQWRYNIVADNGPIDTTISDFVKKWNEKYASPKIVLNTTDKLFRQFEDKYGSQLETVKGDITPYWEDGAASTANEEGKNRANSLRLQQLTTLYSIIDPAKYQPQQFDEAWKNILLFHEHTWGAHNSTTEPNIPFVTEQWRIKKDFMLTANQQINTLTNQLLQPLTNTGANRIAVVNTLSWKRNGAVYLPANFVFNTLKDDMGNQYPLQKLADGRKVFMAERLNPLSVTYFMGVNSVLRPRSQFTITDTTLSNGLITIKWDNKTGSIKQLQNIEGYSFAGDFKNQGLNSFWYVAGRNVADVQTNLQVTKKIDERETVLTSVSFTSEAPGTERLTRKITLFAGDDRVWIENIIDKKKVEAKEAVYFSFPFATSLNKVSFDAGYGTLNYIKDQLPGSNFDFLSQKRWLDVADNNKGVQLLMVEPFMMAPKMVDEQLVIDGAHKKWKAVADSSSTWFSYVMNNYWHTNYKASQDGVSRYYYVLRPHGKLKNFEQEKAAMEFNQPLIAFNVAEGANLTAKSLFALSNNKIVVTSITPQSAKSYKVRLFNPEDAAQLTTIKWQNLKGYEVYNLANNTKIDLTQLMKLDAFEVLDILIRVN